jgi:lariat debranching enzyme
MFGLGQLRQVLTPEGSRECTSDVAVIAKYEIFRLISTIGGISIMRIAVQGCSHGSLSAIYDTIDQHNLHTSIPTDLLLLCGDFQALRSSHDFASLAVPPKYHSLGTFHQYYSGVKTAPVLTIVIGGNHEASNYMWELYYGGWLAEGIYYLGAAGSIMINGLRISGLSGIYKSHDYTKGE